MANEAAWAGQIRADRGRRDEEEDDELMDNTREAVTEIVRGRSKLNAVRAGINLGLDLRQRVSDLRFDGFAFYAVLLLSATKDLVDVGTLGFSGWITVPLLTIPLFIIFFLRKSFFKRWFIKNFLWKYVATLIFEFSPVTSIFPAFTISTLLLKMSVEKEVNKLKNEIREIDKTGS